MSNGQMFDAETVPGGDGAELLDDLADYLARFVVYPGKAEHHAHVLWIAHTWLMEHWESTPRIAFLSPEPGSGKSRALEVTEPVVPRPVHAVNTTPAYLFRKVSDDAGPPTILYDEIDTVFGPKAKDNEDIRGMLNAGHRRGATAGRCVMRGKIVETEELPAYCAVALAGLDDLPDTIMTRAVVVRMRRRAPGEQVQPWRLRVNGPDAHRIRDRLADWSTASADRLGGNFWPDMPEGVADRDADVWEALLAVADIAGGHWPDTARSAAVTLVTASRHRAPSIGVLLLADIKKVFDAETDDVLTTAHIIDGLCKDPEAPWRTIRKGEPIDPRGLSRRLSKYGIGSKPHRAADSVIKGYSRAQFTDAWSRYPVDDGEDGDDGQDDIGGDGQEGGSSAGQAQNLSVTSVTAATPQVTDGADLFTAGEAVTDDRLHGHSPTPPDSTLTSTDTAVTDVTDTSDPSPAPSAEQNGAHRNGQCADCQNRPANPASRLCDYCA